MQLPIIESPWTYDIQSRILTHEYFLVDIHPVAVRNRIRSTITHAKPHGVERGGDRFPGNRRFLFSGYGQRRV
jgi:hypothetical protein